jgi:hypothetical protein
MDKRENFARWEEIRNVYAGERAFLIGNGPSLNATDLGVRLVQHLVFTHIPLGPINGRYLFLKR